MKQSKQNFFGVLCFRMAFFGVSSAVLLSSAFATHPSTIDVDTSPLPRGPGLSSAYYGDVGIESNSSVIFADNFEAGDYLTKWDAGIRRNLITLVDESAIDPVLGNKSIRAAAGNGTEGGAGLIEWFPSNPDAIFVRFYVKFDEQSIDFSHLSRLAANRADNRWSSFGTAGTVPDGENYFVTAIEPTGVNTLGDWKTYTYWPDMPGIYGSNFPSSDPPAVEKDQWISVEVMVKHNTPGTPGVDKGNGVGKGLRDGEQAFWIDGELIGHWGNIRWRDDPALLANAFILESYISGAGVIPGNVAYFDNVVVASEYIGPSGLTEIPEPATGALLITPLILFGTTRMFRRSK